MRTVLKKKILREPLDTHTDTKFPSMNQHTLTKSHSKFHSQLGLSSRAPLIARKAPMKVIEDTILKVKIRMDTVSKKRDRASQEDDEDKRLCYLAEEAAILRAELKNLNYALSLFLEQMKSLQLKTRKNNMDPAERDDRKRIVKEMEAENYDKMTKNLIQEHNRLTKRLDIVSNPDYVYDLRGKVDEMKNYVKELKDSKKRMEKQEKNRDKKLNYMINMGGDIGHMKKINDTHNELTVNRNSLNKVNTKLQKLEETKAHNQDQIKGLTNKLDKLQAVASKHDIDIDKVAKEAEKRHDYEDFNEVRKQLLHKKAVLDNAIKAQKRKYQLIFGTEKKKHAEIMASKQEITQLLQDRESEAAEKKQIIDELKEKYEKYKTEAGFNNFVKPDSGEQSKKDDKPENGKDLERSRSSKKSKRSNSNKNISKQENSNKSERSGLGRKSSENGSDKISQRSQLDKRQSEKPSSRRSSNSKLSKKQPEKVPSRKSSRSRSSKKSQRSRADKKSNRSNSEDKKNDELNKNKAIRKPSTKSKFNLLIIIGDHSEGSQNNKSGKNSPTGNDLVNLK
jgi:hypothetical protein